MATVVVNKKREESRIIYIKSNPVVGLLALTGFVDDNNGPQGSADFIKTFRYTINGVIYSEWIPLTVQAITNIQVDPTDVFVIELSYAKDEPVGTSVLDVDSATLTVTSQATDPKFYFDNSLFKKYFDFNDVNVLNWYVNVLEKLWYENLIPNYMTKDRMSPDDFLAFWGSVAKFFSYYVQYARTFATFYNNVDLIRDFLGQRGLNTSPEDTLQELQYMLKTYHNQLAQRGTINIVNDVADGAEVNGELKRLIFYKAVDEFIFCYYKPENFGWCLGHSSPLYKGMRVNDNINKAPWSKGYTSMQNAASFVTGGSIITDVGNYIARINNGSLSAPNIKVDPNMDYEISFQIKLGSSSRLNFSVTGKDINGSSVALKARKNNTTVTSFFTNAPLSRSDKYVMVRVYLYNKNRGVFADDATSIKQGSNIIMPSTLQSVSLTVGTTGTADIFDFKITPLQTDYSRGFLQSNNFISTWLKNRNSIYTTLQLEAYIMKYLIPYNCHIKVTNIGDLLYTTPEEEVDQTFWVGSGEYCRKVVWIGIDPSCEIKNMIWVPDEDTAICEQV